MIQLEKYHDNFIVRTPKIHKGINQNNDIQNHFETIEEAKQFIGKRQYTTINI